MPRYCTVLAALAVAGLLARATGGPSLTLLFGGDVMLSRQVAAEIAYRKVSPWSNLAPMLRGADVAAANFEGAVGTAAECLPVPGRVGSPEPSLCFAVAPANIPGLRSAGFAALSVENNHAADLGGRGRKQTLQAMQQVGLTALSWNASPIFVERKGVSLGMVAVSLIPGRDGTSAVLPSPDLARKLRLARSLSNLVVVFVHWGTELHDWPSEEQRRDAAWLVAQGADLVICAHPHVIEAPQCVAGKPVFYSLGNLLFDQKYPATRTGMLASCAVGRSRLSCHALLTAPPAGSFFPASAGADASADASLANCQPPLHTTATLGDAHLFEADGKNGERSIVGKRGATVLWKTRPTTLLSLEAAPLAGDGSPVLFTLERHASVLDGEDSVRPYVYQLGPGGPVARWRGTALAWPLLDARMLPGAPGTLCALHRADSFLVPNPKSRGVRIAAYHWDGFGFNGLHDAAVLESCRALLLPEVPAASQLLP